MNTLNKFLSKLPIFSEINGYKTIIGATIVVVGSLLSGTNELIGMFPDVTILTQIHGLLNQVIEPLIKISDFFGWGFIYLGVGHKALKQIEE